MLAKVSAPGKLILMGEHAAVYGRPALVAAIDLRTEIALHSSSEDGVRFELPNLDRSEFRPWSAVRETTASARASWQSYLDDPSLEKMEELRSSDPFRLVEIVLGEAVERFPSKLPERLLLNIRSQIPLGSGFGSSASVAVALAGAVSCVTLGELEIDRIDRVALESERRQHGLPSGIDHATVRNGGVLRAERIGGELDLEPLQANSALLERLQVFHTGAPGEPTGWIVATVRDRWEVHTTEREQLLDQIAEAVSRFESELVRQDGRFDSDAICSSIRVCEAALERLGVVPKSIAGVVRQVEAAGGAAKISGAGSLSEPAAGALLVFAPESCREAVQAVVPYPELEVALGCDGVRLEPESYAG